MRNCYLSKGIYEVYIDINRGNKSSRNSMAFKTSYVNRSKRCSLIEYISNFSCKSAWHGFNVTKRERKTQIMLVVMTNL